MKIAMVAGQANPLVIDETRSSPPPQGQHVHVAELSAALARIGHEVVVYTRRDNPHHPDRVFVPQGYEVVQVAAGPAEPLSCVDSASVMGEFGGFLEREWSQRPPDITHAHYWLSGLATQLAARAVGLPTVQTFHALGLVEERQECTPLSDPPVSDRIRLERLIARGATRMVATSSDEVFELARMGLPRTRTTVVPSGVDPDHYRNADPADPPRTGLHRLLAAGPLAPPSGFDTAIEALASVPATELVIAGYAPDDGAANAADVERERLSDLARRAGVSNRVRIRTAVTHAEMPALLRSADVVLCTPWYDDCSGMVALQAMSCGRPVVASAVGSILDSVLDEVTGVLIPARSAEAAAGAARRLLGDATTRATYGIAARDRVLARYSWDRVAEDTVRAYERCVPVRRTATRTARIGLR